MFVKRFSQVLIPLLCLVWMGLAHSQLTLKLKDTDIRTLIDTVSEATGKNFVIDPRVSGKVTVVSSKSMDAGELYQVFLSILEIHGYSAVESGSVIKIIPNANATKIATPIMGDGNDFEGGELVTRVLEVEHIPVNQLVAILRPMVPQEGQLAAYAPSNVLVISDRASNIKRLEGIVARIDQPDRSELEIIRLQHASATDIVRVLDSMFATTGPEGAVFTRPKLAADERTNSILISGDFPTRVKIRGLLAMLDRETADTGTTQVVYLRYAKAEDLQPLLEGISSSLIDGSTSNDQAVQKAGKATFIAADTQNNALILNAPPDVMQNLLGIIRRLDIRRAQVMVRAIIAEVSNDLSNRLGISLAGTRATDGASPSASTSFSGGTSALSFRNGLSSATVPTGGVLGVANLVGATQWGLLIEALQGDAASNVLSTPTIVTLDNHEAEIVVGSNVPFITGQFTSTNNSADNPFQTIERQDVGLTLKVKPQINEGDSIKLEIDQEVSSIASSAVGASDLVTNKRSLKTTVMVNNSELLVLGGLMDETSSDSLQKVPGLGDVPILGALFSFESSQRLKRNLMIFIYPTILNADSPADRIAREKYSYLRSLQNRDLSQRQTVLPSLHERFPVIDDVLNPKNIPQPASKPLEAENKTQPEPVNAPQDAHSDLDW